MILEKKLYLPTSSLNYNNIMASETISPAVFYTNRDYGFKRFYKVPPNSEDYGLYLYEKCPVYNLIDDELEVHPMVVEVDSQLLQNVKAEKVAEGIYLVQQTILLSSLAVRIIFFEETSMHDTLAMAQKSIETKMERCYTNVILNETIPQFKWESTSNIEIPTFDYIQTIEHDKIVDKLKGFLYAYAIGCEKSLPSYIVNMKKEVRKCSNIFSSIVSSGNPTENQYNELERVAQEFDIFFERASGITEVIDTRLKPYNDVLNQNTLIQFLQNENLYDNWLLKIGVLPNQLHLTSTKTVDEFYEIIKATDKDLEVTKYFKKVNNFIESEIKKIKTHLEIDIDLLPKIAEHQVVSSSANSQLSLTILNHLFISSWNSKNFLRDKVNFVKDIGVAIQKNVPDWVESKEREEINKILTHLHNHDHLDIQSLELVPLRILALFCQKGSELDVLEDHLISHNATNFAFAFGLWGAVHGFVSLPKTYTADFLQKSNFVEFEKYIHEVTCGYKLIDTEQGLRTTGVLENKEYLNKKQSPAVDKSNSTSLPLLNYIEPASKSANGNEAKSITNSNNNSNEIEINRIEPVIGIDDNKCVEKKILFCEDVDAYRHIEKYIPNNPQKEEIEGMLLQDLWWFLAHRLNRTEEKLNDFFTSIEMTLPKNAKIKLSALKKAKQPPKNPPSESWNTDNASVVIGFWTHLFSQQTSTNQKKAYYTKLYCNVERSKIIHELIKFYKVSLADMLSILLIEYKNSSPVIKNDSPLTQLMAWYDCDLNELAKNVVDLRSNLESEKIKTLNYRLNKYLEDRNKEKFLEVYKNYDKVQ